MNSEDGQVYSVCILHAIFLFYFRRNSNKITASSVGITIQNQRIIWKDDIEFVTEFPCLLGHPVRIRIDSLKYEKSSKLGGMDLWIRN